MPINNQQGSWTCADCCDSSELWCGFISIRAVRQSMSVLMTPLHVEYALPHPYHIPAAAIPANKCLARHAAWILIDLAIAVKSETKCLIIFECSPWTTRKCICLFTTSCVCPIEMQLIPCGTQAFIAVCITISLP